MSYLGSPSLGQSTRQTAIKFASVLALLFSVVFAPYQQVQAEGTYVPRTHCVTDGNHTQTYGVSIRGVDPNASAFSVKNGLVVENEGGSAVFAGDLINANGDGFRFYYNFSGYTETPPQGAPYNPQGEDASDWYYYLNMTGTLTGLPGTAYEGAVLKITQRGVTVQFGGGANKWGTGTFDQPLDSLGIGGWFDVEVTKQPTNGPTLTENGGKGDIHVLLNQCAPSEAPAPAKYCISNGSDAHLNGFYLPTFDPRFADREFVNSNWRYSIDNGIYMVNDDDTAMMSGMATNAAGASFAYDVVFSDLVLLPPAGAPRLTQITASDTSDWVYYETVTGTLTGKPGTDYEGAVISLSSVMPAQAGTGANNLAPDTLGSRGWVTLTVTEQPTTGITLTEVTKGDYTVRMHGCEPASLSGELVKDANRNGILEAGENGVGDITVNLWTDDDGNGTPDTQIDDTTTAADGSYSFTGLDPLLVYVVQFDVPADMNMPFTAQDAGDDDAVDSDAGDDGITGPITLTPGEETTDVDAGIITPLSSLSGVFFKDANLDGLQGADEAGLDGLMVKLWTDDDGDDAPDTMLEISVTENGGEYSFTDLDPALTYIVMFNVPADMDMPFTTQDAGDDDSIDSDANADGITGPITLTPGEETTDVDGGVITPRAALGNLVWKDTNRDGIKDADEAGIDGVTVNLWTDDDADGTPDTQIDTTVTADGGIYGFDQLDPALTYVVQFMLPADMDMPFTIQDAGDDDDADSDAGADGITGPINLDPRETDDSIDAGVINPLGSIGNMVWDDQDADGIMDNGEAGIQGVEVILYDENGVEIDRVTTNNNGKYSFDELEAGTYTVEFVSPDGYVASPQDAGDDEALDSDADETTGKVTVTLGIGEDNEDIDAGFYVQPTPTPTNTAVPTATNTPEPTATNTPEPTATNTPEPTATPTNTPEPTATPTLVPATLGNMVWEDLDKDGVMDAGETGIANVTVNLRAGGAVVDTTTTDDAGKYSFTITVPGDYVVEFEAPAGFTASPQDAGGDDALDSDADETTGSTASITVAAGSSNDTVDAGFFIPATVIGATVTPSNTPEPTATDVPATNTPEPTATDVPATNTPAPTATDVPATNTPAPTVTVEPTATPAGTGSIGNYVWKDENGNGLQDEPASAGQNGVTVILQDKDGNELATTVTADDANGNPGFYLFEGLALDSDYKVTFVAPDGYEFTQMDATTAIDLVGYTAVISVEPDPDNSAAPFAIKPLTGTITDAGAEVAQSLSLNAASFPTGKATKGATGANNLTVDVDGLEDLGPDYVYEGWLITTNGAVAAGRFSVDADGNHQTEFALDQADVDAASSYVLTIEPAVGDDPAPSAVHIVAGNFTGTMADLSINHPLALGTDFASADGSTFILAAPTDPTASYRNGIWFTGLNLPTLPNGWVYEGWVVGPDGPISTGTFTDPSAADSDGAGPFAGPEAAPDKPGADFVETATLIAGESDADSDANADMGGMSYVTRLDSAAPNQTQIDAGLVPVSAATATPTAAATNTPAPTATSTPGPTVTATSTPVATATGTKAPLGGSLGDYVWVDTNGNGIQDENDAGISGVTVNLWTDDDNDGTPDTQVDTTTTDTDGKYSFVSLVPGTRYIVQVVEPTTGYNGFSPADQGNDDAIDSDILDGKNYTAVIVLTDSGMNPTIDAGLLLPATATPTPTSTKQPLEKGSIGDTVWNDTDNDGIQEDGEPGLPNYTVQLLNTSGAVLETVTTGTDGSYLFDNLDAGDYVVRFVLNNATTEQFSPQDAGSDDAVDSDANATTGETATISLSSGEEITNVDAGIYVPPLGETLDPPTVEKAIVDEGQLVDTFVGMQGEAVTYRLTITNPNDKAISNVVLTDVLPDGVSYVTYASEDGTVSYAEGTNTVTFTVGDMAANGTAVISIGVRIDDDAAIGSKLRNIGTVTSNAGGTMSNEVVITVIPGEIPNTGDDFLSDANMKAILAGLMVMLIAGVAVSRLGLTALRKQH